MFKKIYLYLLLFNYLFATGISSANIVNDTIVALSNLCWKYRATNPKLALQYGYNALEIINNKSQFERLPKLYNLIGVVYRGIVQYPAAQKYFLLAKEYAEKYNDTIELGFAYNNLGANLYYLYQYDESYYNCLKALNIFHKINHKTGMGFAYHSIVLTLVEKYKLDEAKKYNSLLLKLRFEEKDSVGISKVYSNYVKIYLKENILDSARYYLKLANDYAYNTDNYGYLAALKILNGDYYVKNGKNQEALANYKDALFIAQKIKYWDNLAEVAKKISEIYERNKDFNSALFYFKIYNDAVDSLDAKYSLASVFDINEKYEIAKQRKIEQLEIERERNIRISLSIILALLGFLIAFVYRKNRIINKQNEILIMQKEEILKKNEEIEEYANALEVKNKIIQKEKEKSDLLLNSVFPIPVANELRKKNKIEPQFFKNVSVMFLDIVDFTKYSSTYSPDYIVNELSEIYYEFDRIIEKYKGTKIKTVGDAYLIASGLPEYFDNNLENLVCIAKEIFEYLIERNRKHKFQCEVRVGLHYGDVTAGIIGISQLSYDIWGDTVNIASRLERASEPFKINVSECVKKELENKYNFIERGEIEVKGKGLMKMYYLNLPNFDYVSDRLKGRKYNNN